MCGRDCLSESWRELRRNSPGKTHGHRALASAVCARRYPGQPVPGDTACMLEGREQMAPGMSASAGPGEASLRAVPHGPALSLPSWLMGRAGGLGEEGGIAGPGVPAGARCLAWAPLAEERRGPAPGRLGSSCLPLPPLSAPR